MSSELGEAFRELMIQEGAPIVEHSIVAEASATLLEDDMPAGHDADMVGIGLVASGFTAARPATDEDAEEWSGKWVVSVDREGTGWMTMHLMQRETAEKLYEDLGKVLFKGEE